MSDMNLPIPDFVDVDSSAVVAAEAAAGERTGAQWSLPTGVTFSAPTGAKRTSHARWNEEATVTSAYRTVTAKGLLDVVVIVKARTGQPNEKNGNAFLHFYINNDVLTGTADSEVMKKHGGMTEKSIGVLAQLIRISSFMPASNKLTAGLLATLFPAKGQLGAKSPLDGKSINIRVHVGSTPKQVKDETTGEFVEVADLRLEADAFLPSTVA